MIAHAKVIKVIITESTGGKGIKSDPYRTITEYFHLNGESIVKIDPKKE